MIRFFWNVHSVEYRKLDKDGIQAFFRETFQENMMCVLQDGEYIGHITYDSIQQCSAMDECIQKDYVIMDNGIWQNARKYFMEHKTTFLPVLNKSHQVICYAWQDFMADRELRMLKELERCEEGVTFQDMNPGCMGVTIHECNELAWKFLRYLEKRNVPVNVEGRIWEEIWPSAPNNIPAGPGFEVWAEGVHIKSGNWKQERKRSASVEFECLDKIYEENIKNGIIADAFGTVDEFLERLKKNKEIVIRGIGTKAQDAYNWLMEHGIDICAFQSGHTERKALFGKPVMAKKDIAIQFPKAVLIECSAKHSAWGFGEVDRYDYEGYERNKRYFLLRDYLEVSGSNLVHIMKGKNLVLTGEPALCKRAMRWWEHHGLETGNICYGDVTGKEKENAERLGLPVITVEGQEKSSRYLLFISQYSSDKVYENPVMENQAHRYAKCLEKHGIYDYTDYFSDIYKSVALETKTGRYLRAELRPKGILLGAITTHSGNMLLRQCLAGHPQVIVMEEYNFLNHRLYDICIRLAEEKPDMVLPAFWTIYQKEAKEGAIDRDFPDKGKFHGKMEELLRIGTHFTSQELFVMFHIAYTAMYGTEIKQINQMLIYWEPHNWGVDIEREWADWLCEKGVLGTTVCMVRNRYIHAGSCLRGHELAWQHQWVLAYDASIGEKKEKDDWKECRIKFEDLKCSPKEILTHLCTQMGIAFHESLLDTTYHNEKAYYLGVTGFDLKPAYNLYEEYFNGFDRMRIAMLSASYQRKYGYPYTSSIEFSRRELQEMFLKEFRYEKNLEHGDRNLEDFMYNRWFHFHDILWRERFAEVMHEDGEI